jgi:hypothetical protein
MGESPPKTASVFLKFEMVKKENGNKIYRPISRWVSDAVNIVRNKPEFDDLRSRVTSRSKALEELEKLDVLAKVGGRNQADFECDRLKALTVEGGQSIASVVIQVISQQVDDRFNDTEVLLAQAAERDAQILTCIGENNLIARDIRAALLVSEPPKSAGQELSAIDQFKVVVCYLIQFES